MAQIKLTADGVTIKDNLRSFQLHLTDQEIDLLHPYLWMWAQTSRPADQIHDELLKALAFEKTQIGVGDDQ